MSDCPPPLRVSRDQPAPDGPGPLAVLQVAAATALSLALLECGAGHVLRTGVEEVRAALGTGTWGLLQAYLPGFATTTLVGSLTVAGVWWLGVAPLGRLLRAHPGPLLVAYAGGLVALALLCLTAIVAARTGGATVSPSDVVWTPAVAVVAAFAIYVLRTAYASSAPPRAGHSLSSVVLCAGILGLLVFKRGPLGQGVILVVALGAFVLFAGLATVLLVRQRGQAASTVAIAGLFLLALAAPFVSAGRDAGGERGTVGNPDARRVFLIVVDTLRSDFVSYAGGEAPATPNLDRMAGDAVVFERAYATSPWTLPSMISVMTGLSSLVHGAVHLGSVVPSGLPTLAEQLLGAGFRTAAFGQNGLLLPRSRLDRGFERYSVFRLQGERVPLVGDWLLSLVLPDDRPRQGSARHLNELALDWIDEHADEDLFVWMHYFDVHLPYEPAPELLNEELRPPGGADRLASATPIRQGLHVPDPQERLWIRELYAAGVRELDAEIGRFLDELERRGMYQDATIVFTSDHGEELWEHGGFEHGHDVHEEIVRVPLFVRLPGGRSARVEDPVAIDSILPTILSLQDVHYDAEATTGVPLVSAFGDAAPAPGPVVCTGNLYYENRTAVIGDGQKYVRVDVTQEERLYDLGADPDTQRSLAARGGEPLERARDVYAATLQAALEMRRRLGLRDERGVPMGVDLLAELRSLGYAGDDEE